MPLRTTVSALEASIIPQIRSYIQSRVDENKNKKNLDPDDSVKMLSDAIALGINEAFKSPAMSGMLSAIVDTNASVVIPIGTTAYSTIMTPATLPTVPNPLLR